MLNRKHMKNRLTALVSLPTTDKNQHDKGKPRRKRWALVSALTVAFAGISVGAFAQAPPGDGGGGFSGGGDGGGAAVGPPSPVVEWEKKSRLP